MTKINRTLLNKLFVERNPQEKNPEVSKYYNSLFFRIYNGSEDFVMFLRSQYIDRQYEYAERIMKKLCFYSNFPPPYSTINDVACVEEFRKNATNYKDDYMPRDHFVHIVYLYLLGIYVFFYSEELYDRIIMDNRYRRKGNYTDNIDFDCIKDFISEWKYFCLYHDVGYSAELLGNTNTYPLDIRTKIIDNLKECNSGFVCSLEHGMIIKEEAYYSSVELISKFLFAKAIIRYSHETIDKEHRLFDNIEKSEMYVWRNKKRIIQRISTEEIKKYLLNGTILDKIYTNQCLKYVLPHINKKDLLVIGIEKTTGNIGFISCEIKGIRSLIYDKKLKSNQEINAFKENINLMLFDDYSSESFDLLFVIQNKDEQLSALEELDIKEYFTFIEKYFSSTIESMYSKVNSEEQFLNMLFDIYEKIEYIINGRYHEPMLQEILNSEESYNLKEDEELIFRSRYADVISHNILAEIVGIKKKFGEKCINILLDKINNLMKDYIITTNGANYELVLSCFVHSFISYTKQIVNDKMFENLCYNKVIEEYENETKCLIDLMYAFSNIYIKIRNLFSKASQDCFEYNYQTCNFTDSKYLEDIIGCKIKKELKITYKDVYNTYNYRRYGNTCDHGFVSASYAASVFDVFKNVIKNQDQKNYCKCLSVLFDVSPLETKDAGLKFIDNYEYIKTNVLFSMFVHNIYPESFKNGSLGKKYRVNINDTFTFFAMICDFLQCWNRPQSIHNTLHHRRHIVNVSEDFDIIVNEKGILIIEPDKTSRYEIEKKVVGLSDYINNADSFIRVE